MPRVVEVLLPIPVQPFHYLLPPGLEPGPVGGRVAVPWQGSVRIGLAVGLEELPHSRTSDFREVVAWLDDRPFILPAATGLLLDLARSSATPPGIVLASLVPTGLREELVHEVQAVEGAAVLGVPADEWVNATDLGSGELDLYRQQGMVRERVRPVEPTVTRLVPVPSETLQSDKAKEEEALAGKSRENQRRALAYLRQTGSAESAAALAREAEVPASSVRSLVSKGFAEYREVTAPPADLDLPEPAEEPLQGRGEPLPLADVTLLTGGLRRDRLAALLPTIERQLELGRSVLILAPEAAYLREAASLLGSRLPVLVLSGEANDRQRERIWDEVASGEPVVLIGIHGALLAPFPNPGLIVVLEAGSGTYKLLSGPRLFMPTAARELAKALDVPLILADVLASPEMSSWAGNGEAIELPPPAQRLFVSDLARVTGWPVGSELTQVLRQVQDRGRQAVLLAPRRGFSAALTCRDCGHTVMCPNCDLALRYQRSGDRLRCHQCGHTEEPPTQCPNCSGFDLSPGRAAGTEWVAQAVAGLVPELTVLRFDRDRQDDLEPLRRGAPGVLVGTTGMLRLPPLPNVSLVGVTLFDTHLNVSDFRAAEESLRLLLQLPELAPGRRPLVVVQTFQPEHDLLGALGGGDPALAVTEYRNRILQRRQAFAYPPFGQLAKIQVSARDNATAQQGALRLAGTLETSGADAEELLGPVPAPISRVRGQYSYLVYLRSADEARFRQLLEEIPRSLPGVRIRVDVDPRDVAEFLE